MSHISRRIGVLVLSSCLSILCAAQSISDVQDLYDAQKYNEALEMLQALDDSEERVRFWQARLWHELGRVEESLEVTAQLVQEKKPEREYLYLHARNLHRQHHFIDAIEYYKSYLKAGKISDDEKRDVIERITRSLQGINAKLLGQSNWQLSNAGSVFNSQQDDILPLIDPKEPDVYYFSSNRYGLGSNEEYFDKSISNMDIFVVERVNGRWTPARSLSEAVNSPLNERAISIWDDELIFTRSSLQSGEYYISNDRFNSDSREITAARIDFSWPVKLEEGDQPVFMVGDSLLLFTSDRRGGIGSQDLYYSRLEDDQWSEAINFGPTINSPFNESYASLSADGRTLYFSSDRTSSMGAYDIFQATWDSTAQEWTSVKNMGFPINSASSEMHFISLPNGSGALLSSDRPQGQGQQDIYFAYRKKNKKKEKIKTPIITTPESDHVQQTEKEENVLPTTNDKKPTQEDQNVIKNELVTRLDTAETPKNTTPQERQKSSMETVYISPLFYKSLRDLNRPANAQQLNDVIQAMQADSSAEVLIQVFTQNSGNKARDLYYSTRPGTIVYNDFIDAGISPTRVHLQGFGSYHPVARAAQQTDDASAYAQKLNSHIRLEVVNASYADFYYKNIDVNRNFRSLRYGKLQRMNRGISYRLFLFRDAVQSSHPILEGETFMIAKNGKSYDYLYGHFKDLDQAVAEKERLQKEGFKELRIQAYYDGLQLDKTKAQELSMQYPELKTYLSLQEK